MTTPELEQSCSLPLKALPCSRWPGGCAGGRAETNRSNIVETRQLKIRSVEVFAVFMEDGGMLHVTDWPGGWEPRVGEIIPVHVKNMDDRGRIDYETTLQPQWEDGMRRKCVYSTTWVGRKSHPDYKKSETVEFVFRAEHGVWMKILDGREYLFSAKTPEDRHTNVNDWDRGRAAAHIFSPWSS